MITVNKLLIQILLTAILTGCATYKFGDATKLAVGVAIIAAEAKQDEEIHKCKMDPDCELEQ